MVLFRMLTPLIYSIFVSMFFSVVFKKKFIESVAPAYFCQMLMMLITGMICNNIIIGIVAFCVLACVGMVSGLAKEDGRQFFKTQVNPINVETGFWFFIFVYFLIYVTNYGKHFFIWDEFSHWGIFIKESYRLNALFCTSPATMAHKDYVPAITLFETLWCKLAFRYSEADSYRGIQMLQMSMILPMIFHIKDKVLSKTILRIVLRFIIIASLPLYLVCRELSFYHSIYQDYIFGVMAFYVAYLIITEVKAGKAYYCFVVTLAITIFVNAKMTAMAFLPFMCALFWLYNARFSNEKRQISNIFITLITVIVPMSIWLAFNTYVDKYVSNSGSGQSYDGLSIQRIVSILTHDGSISYQAEVDNSYISALFKTSIYGKMSYVIIVGFVVLGMIFVLKRVTNESSRREVLVINVWTIIVAIFYAFLMWLLYLTSFVEYEAVRLASYARYMSSLVIMIIYLFAFAVFYYLGDIDYSKTTLAAIFLIVISIVWITCDGFWQVMPGKFRDETAPFENESALINDIVGENESVYVVTRGGNGDAFAKINYRCTPRPMTWGSPGPAIDEDDIYSVDYTIEELYDTLSDYDFVCFIDVDDLFIEKYATVFDDADKIQQGTLYRLYSNNGKIQLLK